VAVCLCTSLRRHISITVPYGHNVVVVVVVVVTFKLLHLAEICTLTSAFYCTCANSESVLRAGQTERQADLDAVDCVFSVPDGGRQLMSAASAVLVHSAEWSTSCR